MFGYNVETRELDNTPGRVKIVQDYVLCRAKQKMCHLYCPLFSWCYMYIQFLMMTRWYNKSKSDSLDRKKQEPRSGNTVNNGN
jgi:hypothetical protein